MTVMAATNATHTQKGVSKEAKFVPEVSAAARTKVNWPGNHMVGCVASNPRHQTPSLGHLGDVRSRCRKGDL